MVKPRFVHLRVHSDYSMIDGLAQTQKLIKKISEIGMPALAITDHTNLFGLIKFYKSAYQEGIKPIVGADFFVRSELFVNENTDLTVLAMNNIGYQNLILLISRAYKRGFGSFGPWINREWLTDLNDGLLLISGGKTGELGKCLLRCDKNLVEKCLNFYKKNFKDRYYLELIRTNRIDEEIYLNEAVNLAEKHGMPVVATNDVRFIDSIDFDAHEIRVAIHDGFILEDPKRPKNYSPKQYLRNEQEMCELFSDIPEALENSVEIAKRCNVTIQLGKYFLPRFSTGNMTTKDFLILKSKEGLEERLQFLYPDLNERKKNRKKYDSRLDIELKVINQMGFPDYFLIVMEFIRWSKEHAVPVGPGRGSGAGSLVAYVLKITDLNPLEFDLLFERFLNPERVSMPDFDIDFCMERREKVIEHIAKKYGRDSVSQIITFGKMAAKAVIRDVGRVLGYPYSFVNKFSKLIPSDPGITILQAFKVEPKLQKIYESNKEIKILVDTARKLEGVTRNVGKHAGGIVIAPTKITDFSPLYCDETGKHPVTQFDKNDIESVGLVKFDFLGLRTLTVINWATETINMRRKKNKESLLNINNIPLNDKKSLEMLQRSETTAVFQLESKGIKDLIKRLHPDCFEDMIALVALFRPGPLNSGMVDNFINRKLGLEKISYPDSQWQHKSLKPVLEATYGIILYQEQVMQIAQVLSGYTLGGADILRRAMGKKNPNEMAKQRFIFKEGAKKNGIDNELSMRIFDLVEKFAGYGFNKSHSAAYAMVSYQTLWLKTHYPAEFMAAVMTADMNNTEKIVEMVNECNRMGIKVLPPDINFGSYHFHVNEKGEIIYGIGAIKGVGESSIKSIIEERNNNGYFYEIFDFCSRTNNKKLNRRVLEKLIMSGAFDNLGSHRAMLMNSLETALKSADQHAKSEATGQTDMFGFLETRNEHIQQQSFIQCHPWTEQVTLDNEKKALGLYLTGHPINQYLKEINHYTNGYRLKDIYLKKHGDIITIAGIAVSVNFLINKCGNRIAFCTLDDCSGSLDVAFFTKELEKYQKILERDRILIINGQVNFNKFKNEFKIIAQNAMDINEARKKYARRLAIYLLDKQINKRFLNQLQEFINPHLLGTIPVQLYSQQRSKLILSNVNSTWRVSLSNHLLNDLRRLVGLEQIELEFE